MATEEAHAHSHGVDDHHPHVSPISILLGVYAVLIFLTALTVAVTWVDLGPANIWIALGVAVVKAGVVAMFYMHLKYENPFFGQVLIASIFFVALFIGVAMLDSREYKPTINAADEAKATAAASATSPAAVSTATTNDAP